MTSTGTPKTPAEVTAYADKILALIDADITAGCEGSAIGIPADVPSFTDLQSYVDANQYVIDAGVPSGTDPGAGEESVGTVNTVTAEVDRRLAARTACPRCGGSDCACKWHIADAIQKWTGTDYDTAADIAARVWIEVHPSSAADDLCACTVTVGGLRYRHPRSAHNLPVPS
jgi:hypothetical protein